MSVRIAVIGGGPAGYPAALTAARLGAQVTLVEKAQLGGVCLHCGCIPSKTLLEAAHRLDVLKEIASFTDTDTFTSPAVSWPKIQTRQQAITQKLTTGITALLKQAKVTVLSGTAEFVDGHTLSVQTASGTQQVPFDKVLIATGSKAFVPDLLNQVTSYVYDNSTIFQLPALPHTLAIIGGGAIGCEFATLMSSLGVQVKLIEMQPRLLPTMDESVSRVLTKNLQKRGVELWLGQQVVAATQRGTQVLLQLQDGTAISTDLILAAIGRVCDLTSLHPERAGLTWNRKGLENVHPHTLQITDNVYAAGDVTGLCLLAHAATRQGIVAAHNMCGQAAVYDNHFIPNAVYTTPEVASVGLTKSQADAQGIPVKSHKSYMLASGRAQTMQETDGFIEIISHSTTDQIVGATLATPHASELISIISVALQAKMTVQQLKQVVFAHPTLSESIAEALSK